MADMVLELQGKHFRRQYLLYIIELSHGSDKYFYVGQTGDSRYITARPAFRRLAAHFEDSQSTQNQVYYYISYDILGFEQTQGKKSAFTPEAKQEVENYLVDSTIKMHVYSLEPFLPLATPQEHSEKRRKVTLLEKHVIDAFVKSRKGLMNKKLTMPSSPTCPYPDVFKRIIDDFSLII